MFYMQPHGGNYKATVNIKNVYIKLEKAKTEMYQCSDYNCKTMQTIRMGTRRRHVQIKILNLVKGL